MDPELSTQTKGKHVLSFCFALGFSVLFFWSVHVILSNLTHCTQNGHCTLITIISPNSEFVFTIISMPTDHCGLLTFSVMNITPYI